MVKAFRIKKDTIRGRGEKQKELMVIGQKSISVNDQSSNSIENYVNSVYSVKWHINILLYCSLIDSSFNSSHFENIYILLMKEKFKK